MRELSLTDLEVEIMAAIRKWRDEVMKDTSLLIELDAGDASKLASEIATQVIGHGVGIVGPWEVHRRLNEGWAWQTKAP